LKDNFPLEVHSEIPAEPVVFHWHGDTFDLPENSKVLASSTATPHQAFIYKDNVIGLQFHLETTNQAVKNLLEHAGDEVVEGRYIQTPEQMLTTRQYIEANRKFLCTILDYLCKRS
jgi:GMP synthase-like glutamine amidotransferase